MLERTIQKQHEYQTPHAIPFVIVSEHNTITRPSLIVPPVRDNVDTLRSNSMAVDNLT